MMALIHDEQKDIWDSAFFLKSPAFWPLEVFAKQFVGFKKWPSLENFNDSFAEHRQQNALKFVEQRGKQKVVDYIEQIAFSSEVPSRQGNWHDYFNMLCWQAFPQTRRRINELQVAALGQQSPSERGIVRTALLDSLTHLDECGVAFLSSSKELLSAIREFSWKEAFLERRQLFANSVDVIVFGHGLYAQLLRPYIGITGRSLLIECTADYFVKPESRRLNLADHWIAERIEQVETPKQLSPLPLLGVPGWLEENENSKFYENKNYFRPGRQQKSILAN
tara:strand:- start:1443 stop:2279 length:837 start_codon:yes stop_codon:yes gene_type:complete